MARRGRSVRVAPGIYRDAGGYRVVVSLPRREGETRTPRHEKRFPLTAALATLEAWQRRTAATLRSRRLVFVGQRGTLSGDIRTYLRTTRHQASYKAKRAELHAWETALGGTTDRLRVTALDIKTTVSTWLADGVAPKTVHNRLITFRALWHALDGPRAETPADGVRVDLPKRHPVVVAPTLVAAVAAALARQEQPRTKGKPHGRIADAKTRARFMVLATTGIRPAQLKRITRAHVDLARRTVQVPGAKGGPAVALWLNEEMLAAWQLFVAAEAWGTWDTRSWARVLRTAGWPADVRPYNLRHGLGQAAIEGGEDYEDVKDWLGHADVATTKAFYVPTQSGRLRALSERIDGRFGWAPGAARGATRATTHLHKSEQKRRKP